MDLTTLASDDTPGRVQRLCAKARRPVRQDILDDLGVHVAAVCVLHVFVETAVRALEGSGIPVAAVSTGFPAGLSPLPQRLAEIEASAVSRPTARWPTGIPISTSSSPTAASGPTAPSCAGPAGRPMTAPP